MVCSVCPGLQSVTLARRILKLREDGHLRVTNAFTTHTVRQFNRHQRPKSSDPIQATAINRPQRSKSSDALKRHLLTRCEDPRHTARTTRQLLPTNQNLLSARGSQANNF